MKILLIGYGKMGKAIEKIATERKHEIAGRLDIGDSGSFPPADVAIEFTQPEAAVSNLKRCMDAGIPVVCGTTGWYDKKEEVERYCAEKKAAILYASNFSLGVNIFFRLNEYLAAMMDKFPEYRVSIDETHHSQKKDSPSGTAIALAEGVLKNSSRKKEWVTKENLNPDALVIRSFRIDPAAGTHVVKYESSTDSMEIKHTAHSRDGFARGAVLAAEWLQGKNGVFSMDDFLKF